MRALVTKYRIDRSCSHKEADRSEARCHLYEVEVICGASTKSGQIQLTSIWAEEDGVRYTWFQLSEEMRQEVFEAVDEENCRNICAEALEAVVS